MPTLYRWFQTEYARLRQVGKSHLADEFEAYRQSYFDFDYPTVLAAIPRLLRMCDDLDEPAISLLVEYYHITAESYWIGNLASGLDIATRALVQAHRTLGGNTVPEFYARLSLLDKWLDTDGRGYAPDVLKTLEDIPENLPRDLALRFELLHAYAIMQIDPEQALTELLGIIPRLGYDWPEAYRFSMRGDALLEVGRYDEARTEFLNAHRAYEEMNHYILAAGTQIGAGETYLRASRYEEAVTQLRAACSAVDRTMNIALAANVRGLMGQARAGLGDYHEAIRSLSEALDRLEGLGWLRMEAKFSVARFQIGCKFMDGDDPDLAAWRADAKLRAGRLRSDDLMQALQDTESD